MVAVERRDELVEHGVLADETVLCCHNDGYMSILYWTTPERNLMYANGLWGIRYIKVDSSVVTNVPATLVGR